MSSDSDPKEKEALRALSNRMVKVFENSPSQFMSEGAELSSVTTGKDYEDLLRAFTNAIIKGTADGNNLDQTLLTYSTSKWHQQACGTATPPKPRRVSDNNYDGNATAESGLA
jgi:hypothetical protein